MNYFIYYCILIVIILFFACMNTLYSKESFTPGISSMYRPIARNTRIISEGFLNKSSTVFSNLFRKFGIL